MRKTFTLVCSTVAAPCTLATVTRYTSVFNDAITSTASAMSGSVIFKDIRCVCFLSWISYTNSWTNPCCSCCGKEMIPFVTDPQNLELKGSQWKNVACGLSQCDVCYCQEVPVMVFQGLFKTTCPTTEVSKSNAGYRNVALSLANIQSIVVCFELSLPSSCPVNLHFCLWFPLWLHGAPSRLACSWNHRRFLWVTRLMTWN